MLIQAITIADQFYDQAINSVDFIQKFIFPGGFIPSVSAIAGSVKQATDMRLFHLEDIGPHYATTLQHWRERFFENIEQVKALGYSEQFIRMWEFYLCYSEGGFLERALGDAHLVFIKPENRIDWRGISFKSPVIPASECYPKVSVTPAKERHPSEGTSPQRRLGLGSIELRC